MASFLDGDGVTYLWRKIKEAIKGITAADVGALSSTDTTLSRSGQAADAKAAGDRIGKVSDSTTEIDERLTSFEEMTLDEAITPGDNFLIPIHDGTSLKKVTFANFRNKATEKTEAKIAPLLFNNAGAHNAIYRGKYLGSTVTAAQYNAIQAGTFDDLYIGDYWTINNVNYRIAAFDYYLNCGNSNYTIHHVVIVPDTSLYNAQMRNTSSETGSATAGGYVGSDMYTTNLNTAKTIIKNAFTDHILKHRIFLTNAVSNGHASAVIWCDSEVDLMCEQMVYGSGIFSPISDGSAILANYKVEKSQLPLFQHCPSLIGNRNAWWLRDVVSAVDFACVAGNGQANADNMSYSHGVRPSFCIS